MFVCDECGRQYQSHETLKRHRRNHIESINYTCDVCGASFKRKDLLKKHGRTHMDPRLRSQRACVSCSSLKLKCDSGTPCSRCAGSGIECVYRSDRDPVLPNDDESIKLVPSIGDSSTSKVRDKRPIRSMSSPSSTSMSPDDQSVTSFGSLNTDMFGMIDLNESDEYNFGQALSSRDSGPSQGRNKARSFDERHHSIPRGWNATIEIPKQNFLPFASHPSILTWNPADFVRSPEALSQPATYENYSPTTRQVVQSLVQEASSLGSMPVSQEHRAEFWSRAANKIERAFQIQSHSSSGTHVFNYFIGLYFHHFHHTWPIMWKTGIAREDLAPYTYLMMTAIGAAYSDAAAARYHNEILKFLGPLLLQCCHEPQTENAALSLSQSILMFQVSVLYFGRSDAFLLCHQLSGAWIPICRRFVLHDDTMSIDEPSILADFVKSETRRRLILTFIQVEIATNALLGFQPLLRVQEMKLSSLVPDSIWLSEDRDDMVAYQKHGQENQESSIFADMIHATLDPESPPPELPLHELELLLSGLLHLLWSLPATFSPGEANEAQGVDPRVQDITAQRTQRVRLSTALRKCKTSLDQNSTHVYAIPERTSLLTSIYLNGVSIFRLNADILSLCKLARSCCVSDPSITPTSAAVIAAKSWANSRSALACVDAACFLWARTMDELLTVPPALRADFKIIAHVGLLYSAIVVWVFCGCRSDGLTMRLNHYRSTESQSTGQGNNESINLRAENREVLLRSFAELLVRIQPVRHTHRMGFAVYQDIVSTLSKRDFPLS